MAAGLVLGAGLSAAALPAAAADPVGFTIDDFNGHSMGPRTVPATSDWTCEPSQGSSVVVSGGQMRVTMPGRYTPGNSACAIAGTWVDWTPANPVDITNGHTVDRIVMKYQDVQPQRDGNPISFGIQVTDVNGRTGTAGGLARGKEDNFLSVRYAADPANPADPAWLAPAWNQPLPDLTQIRTLRLTVSGTLQDTTTAVTFTSLGFVMNEPTYEQPAIPDPGPWVFPVSTTTTRTLDVTGFPEPNVSISGGPAWLTGSSVKGDHQSRLTVSGSPTAYADTTVHVHATVTDSLVADRDIRVVVPSPVTFTPASSPATTVGAPGPVTLGTVASTPVAAATLTSGLPSGTALRVRNGTLELTGTPTAGGTYTVVTTLDSGFATKQVSVPVTVATPPTVAATADLELVRGVAVSPVDIAVGGVPAPSVLVAGLPGGLTTTRTGTGVRITGTPAADGTSTVTVTAHNTAGDASRTFGVLVGTPAALTAPADATLRAGVPVRIPLALTGYPLPTVVPDGLPAGLRVSVDAGETVIDGTPTSAAAGTGTVHLTPSNTFGTGSAVTFGYTVEAPPVLTGPSTVDAHVGSPLAAAYAATGYPVPTLTLTAVDGGAAAIPAGVTVEDGVPGALTLSGTPSSTGTTTVRITADNGVGLPVSRDVTLRSLLTPSFGDATPTIVARAGRPTSLTLDVRGYERPSLSVSGTLPAWLAFDAATGTFSGTPSAADEGDAGPFTITATNGSGATTATLAVRVTTPASLDVTAPDGHATAGAALPTTRIGSVGGFPRPIVTATGLPTGVAVVTDPDGTVRLTGTPLGAGGPFVAQLTARNGVDEDAQATVGWSVWSIPSIDVASSVTLPVGVEAEVPVAVSGYPAPIRVASPALPSGLRFDPVTGSVVGTPDVPGTYSVDLRAENGLGSSPATTVRILVSAEPAFAPAPTTTHLRLGAVVDSTVGGFAGHPTPSVSFSGLPAGLEAAADGGAIHLSGTPTVAGPAQVTVTLSSSAGSTSTSWTVVVDDAARISAPASLSAHLGTALVPAPVSVTGYPVPRVTATGLPAGLRLSDEGDGLAIVGTPTVSGHFTAELTAHNGIDADARSTVEVDVLAPPVLEQPTGTVTFPAGATSTLTVEATGHPAPTLSVTDLPAWLTFDPATGTFTGTPDASDAGPVDPITVEATNNQGSDTAVVRLAVSAPPGAADDHGATTVTAGARVDALLTTVSGYPVPTVSATGLPAGLTITQDAHEVRLTGSTREQGNHAVTLTVGNGIGTAVVVPWTVTVQSQPAMSVEPTVTVALGSSVAVEVAATGFPTPTVVATGLPAGVTWVPGTGGGRLTGTPAAVGSSRVTLTASNGVGQDATATVTLVVTAPVDEGTDPGTDPGTEPGTDPTTEPGSDPARITLSTGSVEAGGSIHVDGGGFAAGEKVDVVLHSTPTLLVSTHADADGTVHTSAVIPASTPVGTHTVVVRGASGASASATLHVLAAGDSLAGTGATLAGPALLGALTVLLGVGAVVLRARRRTV
ncbi:beta strand repeat-containing protein [Cellulomonas edaphi]|uniref:Ig domain-containing protein n=1 Tax=Cellulomonas edaphi TaxID=3053468 RepID=A0ABT7S937_9CELL|nr:putative Ig domain-containing protein [Cellulomons edaphi]MDM7832137.1 putative Ig domain-containing protein [Cellulomons edaphi]